MSWSSIGVVVGLVLGLVVAVSVGWVFKGYAAKETVALLESNRRAALERVRDLEHEIEHQGELLDASAARNMALEVRNRDLLNMVTARPELAELRSLLVAHAGKLARDHAAILERLQRLHAAAFFADPRKDQIRDQTTEG